MLYLEFILHLNIISEIRNVNGQKYNFFKIYRHLDMHKIYAVYGGESFTKGKLYILSGAKYFWLGFCVDSLKSYTRDMLNRE